MAIGKNKRLTKGGKKGGKKKVYVKSSRINIYLLNYSVFLVLSADPFSKKDWYDIKAPANFETRTLGRTLVTRTTGTSMFFFVLHLIK